MTKSPDDSRPAGTADQKTERERRLAQALRDNLRRRKAQARAKANAAAADSAPGVPPTDDDERGG